MGGQVVWMRQSVPMVSSFVPTKKWVEQAFLLRHLNVLTFIGFRDYGYQSFTHLGYVGCYGKYTLGCTVSAVQ